jgi:hypothetical protein
MPQAVRHAMQETSEHCNQAFAYAKLDFSSWCLKTVHESADNVQENAEHAPKALQNAHPVTRQ